MNWPRVLNRSGLVAAGELTALCGCGFAAVYVLTVRTTPGREFADASLRGAGFAYSSVAEAVDAALGVVSVATLLATLAAVALVALVRLRRVPGLTAVGLLIATNASTWALKTRLLTRPDFGLSEITPASHNSLPSGHTTAVFSAVIAFMIVVPARARRLIATVGGACAVMTALATMSAGWHRAGDSIAAFLLVGLWAGIAALVGVLATDDVQIPLVDPSVGGRSLRWLATIIIGSAGLASALGFGLVLVPPLRTSSIGAGLAFLAGGMLIVAAAIAVLSAELLVLNRTDP